MLPSQSRDGSGSEGLPGDKIIGSDGNKENTGGIANHAISGIPGSPGSLSMRHKIKQSFTNLASRLTPKETKTVLRKPSPFAQAPKADTEIAATVPLPESPRSGTPLSNTNSSPAKSPVASPSKTRKYFRFSLSQESKYKMDSKTAKLLLATTRPTGGDAQKSDPALSGNEKGKAPDRGDVEAKSPASMKKKKVAEQASGTSTLSPPQARQENELTTTTITTTTTTTTTTAAAAAAPTGATDKAKGIPKLKARYKGPGPTSSPPRRALAISRPPTPIPRSILDSSSDSEEEEEGGSDLTIQITALLQRLKAGETLGYQLKNPEGYVDDDPDCLDFLEDPECQELMGNTAPRFSSASILQRRRGRRSSDPPLK
ncbi:hypothetical protein TWF718_011306 [Orbilia javanica]|uniref:Uncharacterized protein n=1 Tax=Orbilia javanica TaxID=47235 RepID=A0AAN8MTJ0_9PEZI